MISAEDVTPISMMFDAQIAERVLAIAKTLAAGTVTVPEHLRGNVGDCLAIVMQAASWRLNPFAVAQKTHLVQGKLGYEAQLINAIATSLRVIEGRFRYEYLGDWSKTAKRPKIGKSPKGYDIPVQAWSDADEEGLGVRVTAKMRGEDDVLEHTLWMAQCWPRNSTLWPTNPQQQIAYLAVKQWMRKYAPDAILGIYTVDEMQEEQIIEGTVVQDSRRAGASPGLSGLVERARNEKPPAARGEASVVATQYQDQETAAATAPPADTSPPQASQEAAAGLGEYEWEDEWPKEYLGVLYDKRGVPWSEKAHSINKTVSDDHSWRRKKGTDRREVEAIEAIGRIDVAAVFGRKGAVAEESLPKVVETYRAPATTSGGTLAQGTQGAGENDGPGWSAQQIHDGIVASKTPDEIEGWMDILRSAGLPGEKADALDDLAAACLKAIEDVG